MSDKTPILYGEDKIVCPNGHTRKFFASYTHIAWKVEENIDGGQEAKPLRDKDGCIMLFHCADCGATVVQEIGEDGLPIHYPEAKAT